MAAAAHKEQAFVGLVLLAGIAAFWADLTGVISLYLHTERTGQASFVVQEGMQFRKGPLGGVPVRPALLLTRFLAVFPFGSFADVRQVFQTDATVGMGVQNALIDTVVGIQLQPSLSSADGDAPSCCRTSAFSLEPLLEAGVMVGFGSDCLSAVELGPIVQRGNGGKIALPDVDPHHAGMVLWSGVRRFDGQRNEQIESLPAPIIPEFSLPYFRCLSHQCNVFVIALVGHDDPARSRQQAHSLLRLEGVVVSIDIDQRGRNVVGRVV